MAQSSARTILNAWDLGGVVSPVRRPVTLIASLSEKTAGACTEEELLGLTVGARDAALLRLHQAWFGAEVRGVCACPACGDELEFSVLTHELLCPAHVQATGEGSHQVVVDGYAIAFRLLTCRDLEMAAICRDVDGARRHLLTACLGEVRGLDGSPLQAADLPPEVVSRVGQEMLAADPMAELSFELSCQSCLHSWSEALDVPAFLWAKIEALAGRLLEEVHVLAARYGWTEAVVVDMSNRRRRAYLQMVVA